MLKFNANDPGDTPYKLKRAVKESGLTGQEICDRMKSDFGVKTSRSALSRSISKIKDIHASVQEKRPRNSSLLTD